MKKITLLILLLSRNVFCDNLELYLCDKSYVVVDKLFKIQNKQFIFYTSNNYQTTHTIDVSIIFEEINYGEPIEFSIYDYVSHIQVGQGKYIPVLNNESLNNDTFIDVDSGEHLICIEINKDINWYVKFVNVEYNNIRNDCSKIYPVKNKISNKLYIYPAVGIFVALNDNIQSSYLQMMVLYKNNYILGTFIDIDYYKYNNKKYLTSESNIYNVQWEGNVINTHCGIVVYHNNIINIGSGVGGSILNMPVKYNLPDNHERIRHINYLGYSFYGFVDTNNIPNMSINIISSKYPINNEIYDIVGMSFSFGYKF